MAGRTAEGAALTEIRGERWCVWAEHRRLPALALLAADAFQLAAALLWSRGETAAHVVVSFDERLREAAGREGFQVLPA